MAWTIKSNIASTGVYRILNCGLGQMHWKMDLSVVRFSTDLNYGQILQASKNQIETPVVWME